MSIEVARRLAHQNSRRLLAELADDPSALTVACPEDGRMITHTLAFLGYASLLNSVFEKYPEVVDLVDGKGNTVLHYLVRRSSSVLALDAYLSIANSIDHVNHEGYTALAYCILARKRKAFALLLKRGADPNGNRAEAEATLIVRTCKKPTPWLELGVRNKMSIDRSGSDGFTALTTCCRHGRWRMVKHLVEHFKADINTAGPLRDFPAFYIVRRSDPGLLSWAISRGMRLDVRDVSWSTPADLYHGSDNKMLELIRSQPVARPDTEDIRIPTASEEHPAIMHYTTYSASIDNIIFFIVALLHRHRSRLSIPTKRRPRPFRVTSFDTDVSTRIKMRLAAIERLSHRVNNFIEYHDSNVFYFPTLPPSFPADKVSFYVFSIIGDEGNHSNVVVIDPVHRTIDRFDPEGGQQDPEIDRFLSSRLQKHQQLSTFEYLGPAGSHSLQLMESMARDHRPGDPGGFCTVWCMWYLELRLSNPGLHPSSDDLWVGATEKLRAKGIRKHIRAYSLALSSYKNQMLTRILGEGPENRERFSKEEGSRIRREVDAYIGQ